MRVPISRNVRGLLASVLLVPLSGCCGPCPTGIEQVIERLQKVESRLDRLEGGTRVEADELLRRWPPPEWSEERYRAIAERIVVEGGGFLSKEEAGFFDNFREWQKALNER
jgi:hypothetical protein